MADRLLLSISTTMLSFSMMDLLNEYIHIGSASINKFTALRYLKLIWRKNQDVQEETLEKVVVYPYLLIILNIGITIEHI